MSDERIVRYTLDELRAKRARGESQTDWARVEAMTDEELEALIAGDPDEGVYPEDASAAETAAIVAIPIDREVLAWFQAQGPGAADRMAAALRSHMEAQRATAPA